MGLGLIFGRAPLEWKLAVGVIAFALAWWFRSARGWPRYVVVAMVAVAGFVEPSLSWKILVAAGALALAEWRRRVDAAHEEKDASS
jgi:hypothetical protein